MINIQKLTPPNNENDIKKYWKYTDKIYISCVCITFNQKEYIADTIDSMLAQQTEYQFEIVIHDDCSTDTTRDIILEYKNKYPTIIKLILQKENQYSKGKRILPFAVEESEGIFLTICEGDDFWVDSNKIQKQISMLIENDNYNIVITKAISLCEDQKEYFCDLGDEIKFLSFSECIIGPETDFYPTATFFLRKSIMQSLPDWFYTTAPVGDYYIQLFAAYNNGCIYLPDATSVYRRNAIGSWSSSLNQYKVIKDRNARLVCNRLMKSEMLLNKEQVYFLNKRASMYSKDIAFSHLKAKHYVNFLKSSIKGFYISPYSYIKINYDSIIKLLKRMLKVKI